MKVIAVNGSPRKQWNTARLFDPDANQRRRRDVFPQDEARARELGRRMTEPL
jgi:hypothetical protein